VSFAISSLALFFLQEYNVIVSSESSGGEHDSTGLGAKQKAAHTAFAVRVARNSYALQRTF
jgi:hypothetical protein